MHDSRRRIQDPRFRRLNDLTVASEYENALRESGLDSVDALFAVPNDQRFAKHGLEPWRERLAVTLPVEGHKRCFFLKRFRHPPWSARREVRRSGAAALSVAGVEWTWMLRLAADGIPCPRPVAFGQELRGQKEIRSAVLTEAVPGESLERWVQLWTQDDWPTIQRLIPAVAKLVARFHACGYIHRDLYLSHIFYAPSGENESTQPQERASDVVGSMKREVRSAKIEDRRERDASWFRSSDFGLRTSRLRASVPEPALYAKRQGCLLFLIDLQRMMRPAWGMRRWIVKDLAALNYAAPAPLITRTQRLRWLTEYLGNRKLNAAGRRLAYRVIGKTRRIAAHDRRRQHERSGAA